MVSIEVPYISHPESEFKQLACWIPTYNIAGNEQIAIIQANHNINVLGANVR